MIEPLLWLALLAVTLVAGTIGGVVGFGSAVILLPVCAYAFGAAHAVPILTIAALIGNLSRAAISWGRYAEVYAYDDHTQAFSLEDP